jgi:hypothetical protein
MTTWSYQIDALPSIRFLRGRRRQDGDIQAGRKKRLFAKENPRAFALSAPVRILFQSPERGNDWNRAKEPGRIPPGSQPCLILLMPQAAFAQSQGLDFSRAPSPRAMQADLQEPQPMHFSVSILMDPLFSTTACKAQTRSAKQSEQK